MELIRSLPSEQVDLVVVWNGTMDRGHRVPVPPPVLKHRSQAIHDLMLRAVTSEWQTVRVLAQTALLNERIAQRWLDAAILRGIVETRKAHHRQVNSHWREYRRKPGAWRDR